MSLKDESVMEDFKNITITRVTQDRYCISIKWGKTRHRYYNGSCIGIDHKPNQSATKDRQAGFALLKRQFIDAIRRGWTPEEDWRLSLSNTNGSGSLLKIALEDKLKEKYSYHYVKKLTWLVANLQEHLKQQPLTVHKAAEYLNDPRWTPAMKNNLRRHYLALETSLRKYGYEGSIRTLVKCSRVSEQLHKPIKDVNALLEEIKVFDRNLYLCCLLTYGCLLRPHREIRLLTWGDFNDTLNTVALSGSRTKGKRNRIIPVNEFIKEELLAHRGENWSHKHNVFSKDEKPYAMGYFSTLWTRFKKVSKLLEADQTLYSFRHSASVKVYEKTGSLTKLQQVMGHSSLQVSLTYLRGLNITQLSLEDLPSI